MSTGAPGTADSQAVAAPSEDLATMGVHELIGLLARLEEATRGWPAAAWAGGWTVDDVDVEQILSRQRQVIVELRRRRGR